MAHSKAPPGRPKAALGSEILANPKWKKLGCTKLGIDDQNLAQLEIAPLSIENFMKFQLKLVACVCVLLCIYGPYVIPTYY
jgi:hypothetical protein